MLKTSIVYLFILTANGIGGRSGDVKVIEFETMAACNLAMAEITIAADKQFVRRHAFCVKKDEVK